MYEWPQDLNVTNVFVNKMLESITFTENTIHLQFGNDLSLTIESGYAYSLPPLINENISLPAQQTSLVSSIGDVIIKADIFQKKDLRLWFKGGSMLQVNGSIKEYECYRVQFSDREIFV